MSKPRSHEILVSNVALIIRPENKLMHVLKMLDILFRLQRVQLKLLLTYSCFETSDENGGRLGLYFEA